MQLLDNRSSIKLDESAEPLVGMMLKAPATAARRPRNIWLLFDDSFPQAQITAIYQAPKLPAKYRNLPTLPLINIDVAEYNRWVDFADQWKEQHRHKVRPALEAEDDQ